MHPAPGPGSATAQQPSRGRAPASLLRGLLRALPRRLAGAFAVLFGAATLAFGALQLIPGDPVAVLLGPANTTTPEVREQIRHQLGFDQPVFTQYLHFLGQLLRGDLGQSYQLQRPVAGLVAEQLGPTLQLVGSAVLLALLVATVSAVATAGRRPGLRSLTGAWELVAVSTPSYWLGLVLLTVFSFHLRWFPVAGADGFGSLVLPAVTLALPLAGTLAQVLREGLEAALAQPFAVTVRARGRGRTALVVRHALRHAAVPMVTLTGWLTGSLLGGTVLVEAVFGRPGVGALVLGAVNSRDVPVVIGVVLFSALAFVVISAVVDALYTVLDPRLGNR
ncbi:putative peptide ABC transporter permease protein [Kitasatospora setae KM-6054]|uniref:Putative peptide ABC transporter permease protein n=1 Tax=Kitasatospora setae (strain ATCC 33774 / DSM 43861 / JCM 3304 / KCC A-0304 / NBRC 14216 / KM-6054) TaxID=452652 RepID=E4N2D9_KITSK|nr:putative peptide ABC transporter permease protein [Kitasatospora setae KM-6054]